MDSGTLAYLREDFEKCLLRLRAFETSHHGGSYLGKGEMVSIQSLVAYQSIAPSGAAHYFARRVKHEMRRLSRGHLYRGITQENQLPVGVF